MASNKHISIIVFVLSFAVLILTAGVGFYSVKDFSKYDDYEDKEFIEEDTYQAVFLTSNQIYFGHLKNISEDYLILSDVYYVKIDEENDKSVLLKLGMIEPHAPKDSMILNKDQVLFWENLRSDSQVIKTIGEIKSKSK